jgi:DNA-binding response OmpR family regulator
MPSQSADDRASAVRVLVLEPDLALAEKIRAALEEAAPDATVDVAPTLKQAQSLLVNSKPDLFVLDADAVPDVGQEFLYDLRTSHPNARAVVLTGGHFAAHQEQAAGLGAIHFLEKPFPHGDFVVLAQALLSHPGEGESEKFQGTLSDLHLADIIQLKCMSGASAVLQFTGPKGEKARVYFEGGQVHHATAPGKEGVAAFNEIVSWKGGQISEVSGAGPSPRTIRDDWQMLLMEAVRRIDETQDQRSAMPIRSKQAARKVLVIDDSPMLLSFVKEILSEANYRVTTGATAEEGLASASNEPPDLVLLDYVLPDMKGDEVCERLAQIEATAKTPIVYMSGFGADLQPDEMKNANVIGSLNKPFTSDLLIKTVENYMPKDPSEPNQPEPQYVEEQPPAASNESAWDAPVWPQEESTAPQPETPQPTWPEPETSDESAAQSSETAEIASAAGGTSDAWWSAPAATTSSWEPQPQPASTPVAEEPAAVESAAPAAVEDRPPLNGAFFSGDTSFFSLNGALHTIGKEKLTGTLRSFWNKSTVDLLARNGAIVMVTTRDPVLYCPEAPITLVNVDADQTERGRAEQRETGCPLFLTLAREGLIVKEPAVQLVQHYGQKLFAQLWTAKKVRFVFEQSETLPEFSSDVPGEEDIDHWALMTLRCIQFQDLGESSDIESGSIPAYTRDGYERVQNLRLTVAEAQFASQFNGVRSVAQIAKNLRLDIKFARLTLFRFLALEIVECWPPATTTAKPEKRGFFQKFGFGE